MRLGEWLVSAGASVLMPIALLAEIRTVVPTILRRLALRPLWPEPQRMILRGTVLVAPRSLLVTATDA
jgi:hypothetical protein